MIGRRLAAFGVLAVAGSSTLQAQVGLASAPSHVALVAHVSPRATIGRIGPVRETARRGKIREETVRVRLSANTGYRLMVVGTAAGSLAGSAPRLWVQAESGRFVEVGSGAAVTVIRGRHGVAEFEPEVTFRREHFGPGQRPPVLPVRYEVRIDPLI